jgi:hypothetical protein
MTMASSPPAPEVGELALLLDTSLATELEDGPAPGVLSVAVGVEAVYLRWTMPRALADGFPSSHGLDWARHQAPATPAYRALGDDAKFEWIVAKAREADVRNRRVGLSSLLHSILRCEDTYARTLKYGKETWQSDTVLAVDAVAYDFSCGTGPLVVDKASVRAAMERTRDAGLFLHGACWNVAVHDRRSTSSRKRSRDAAVA